MRRVRVNFLRRKRSIMPPARKAMLGAARAVGHAEGLFAAVAAAAVWTVSVLLTEPEPGVTEAGLNEAVAPGGRPLAVRVTAELKVAPEGVVATATL